MQHAIPFKAYAKQRKPFLTTHYPFLEGKQINAKLRQEWKKIESTSGLSLTKSFKGNKINQASNRPSLWSESSSSLTPFNAFGSESHHSDENDSPYQKNSFKIDRLNQSFYLQGSGHEECYSTFEKSEQLFEKNVFATRSKCNPNRGTKTYLGKAFQVDYQVPEIEYNQIPTNDDKCSILKKNSRASRKPHKHSWKSKVRFTSPQSHSFEQRAKPTEAGKKWTTGDESTLPSSVFLSRKQRDSYSTPISNYEFNESDEPSCVMSYSFFKKEGSGLRSCNAGTILRDKLRNSFCSLRRALSPSTSTKCRKMNGTTPAIAGFGLESKKNSTTGSKADGKKRLSGHFELQPYNQFYNQRRQSKRLQGLKAENQVETNLSKFTRRQERKVDSDNRNMYRSKTGMSKNFDENWLIGCGNVRKIDTSSDNPMDRNLFQWKLSSEKDACLHLISSEDEIEHDDKLYNNPRIDVDDDGFDDNASFYSDDENAALIVRRDQHCQEELQEEDETMQEEDETMQEEDETIDALYGNTNNSAYMHKIQNSLKDFNVGENQRERNEKRETTTAAKSFQNFDPFQWKTKRYPVDYKGSKPVDKKHYNETNSPRKTKGKSLLDTITSVLKKNDQTKNHQQRMGENLFTENDGLKASPWVGASRIKTNKDGIATRLFSSRIGSHQTISHVPFQWDEESLEKGFKEVVSGELEASCSNEEYNDVHPNSNEESDSGELEGRRSNEKHDDIQPYSDEESDSGELERRHSNEKHNDVQPYSNEDSDSVSPVDSLGEFGGSSSDDEELVSKLACQTREVLRGAVKRLQAVKSSIDFPSVSSAPCRQTFRNSILGMDWNMTSHDSALDETTGDSDESSNDSLRVPTSRTTNRISKLEDKDEVSSMPVEHGALCHQKSSKDMRSYCRDQRIEEFSLGHLFEDIFPVNSTLIKADVARRLFQSSDVQSCSNFGSLFDEEVVFL